MNAKRILLYGCALLCGLGLSSASAQMRSHAAPHRNVAMARDFHRSPGHFHHRVFVRNTVFFGGFGFPFWGYPYPYAYYSPYYYYPPYYPEYGYDGQAAGYSSGSLVAEVQQRLSRAGYYSGAIDGIMGDGTRRAIRGYERSHGLPVDGRIDPALLSRLGMS